jgi:hypothetical protein
VEVPEVLITGCRDTQTSADAMIGGRFNGALTYHLVAALTEANGSLTYRQLHDVTTAVSALASTRCPSSSGEPPAPRPAVPVAAPERAAAASSGAPAGAGAARVHRARARPRAVKERCPRPPGIIPGQREWRRRCARGATSGGAPTPAVTRLLEAVRPSRPSICHRERAGALTPPDLLRRATTHLEIEIAAFKL